MPTSDHLLPGSEEHGPTSPGSDSYRSVCKWQPLQNRQRTVLSQKVEMMLNVTMCVPGAVVKAIRPSTCSQSYSSYVLGLGIIFCSGYSLYLVRICCIWKGSIRPWVSVARSGKLPRVGWPKYERAFYLGRI